LTALTCSPLVQIIQTTTVLPPIADAAMATASQVRKSLSGPFESGVGFGNGCILFFPGLNESHD
jgi:hypothetical protein